ncbi:MAG: hypothetical protein P9M14_08770 [Candidatus Alcyoniella australis]|nr:hypothetical protein [Candidatus Alcyoniella australis]
MERHLRRRWFPLLPRRCRGVGTLSSNWLNWALSATRGLRDGIDSRPQSPSYGCADPEFWRERRRGMCNAATQGAALPLAQMALYDGPQDFQVDEEERRELLALSMAALRYGLGLVARDGSIPSRCAAERSPLTTALAAAPLFEAACLLHEHLDAELQREVERASMRCSGFMVRFNEPRISTFNGLLAAWVVDRAAKAGRLPSLHLKARDMLERSLEPSGFGGRLMVEGNGRDPAMAAACLGILARFGNGEIPRSLRRRCRSLAQQLAELTMPGGPLAGGCGSAFGGLALPFGAACLGVDLAHHGGLDQAQRWHPLSAAWICSDLWHAAVRGLAQGEPSAEHGHVPFILAQHQAHGLRGLADPERGLCFGLSFGDGANIVLDEGVLVEVKGLGLCATGMPDAGLRYRLDQGRWQCNGASKLLRDPRFQRPLPYWSRLNSDLAYQVYRRRSDRLQRPPLGPVEFRRELRFNERSVICVDELRYQIDLPIVSIKIGGPLPYVERLFGLSRAAALPGSVAVPPEDVARLMREGRLRITRELGEQGLTSVTFD